MAQAGLILDLRIDLGFIIIFNNKKMTPSLISHFSVSIVPPWCSSSVA